MQVTLKEIADQAGVSICTVSRVLNGKNKDVYRPAAKRAARIRAVADRLGFVPNSAARTMRRSGSRIIGLLVNENPMATLVDSETILGINEGLEAQGYLLALIRAADVQHSGHSHNTRSRKRRRGDLDQPPLDMPGVGHPSPAFNERMLDAMIVLGMISPALCQLVERVAPVCLWMDTNVQRPDNCLRRDERHSGRVVATQLIERGYRRLIHIQPRFGMKASSHYSSIDRTDAVAEAALEAGVDFQTLPLHVESVDRAAAELQPLIPTLTRDTALICANDRVAITVLSLLATAGVRPGVDVGLAACDRGRHTQTFWPNLSCVDVQRYDLGRQAADMAGKILRSPDGTCSSQTVRWQWHEGGTAPPVSMTP